MVREGRDVSMGKTTGPTGVVSEMIKASGDFGSRCSGDLSRVADGFKCRRCNGTIQEADLMVDGETYECVKSFCYMGDTLDGYGGADLAAKTRIRNGWMKFRELLPFLLSRSPPPPLEMKGITLGLDGMLLSDRMVWCGSGCVPWSFDARLCVDTFSVECSVTHHSIAQL